MKTIYRTIFAICISTVCINATAQNAKDSTLIRQVLLERDYNPTLQDASKINTLPFLYNPETKAKDFQFIGTAPQLKLNNNQLGSVESGDIKTNVDFSKKRGYINLGAGSHSNIDGAAGYRILNTAEDHLDIFATHSSTSSTIDYIDGSKYIMDDVKAKYSATNVNLKYKHIFEPSIFSFDASFLNTSYNYYGNSFIGNTQGANASFPYDITSKQNVDVVNFGAGLKSSDKNQGLLKYAGSLRYQNFKSKYGLHADEDGIKGGQLDLDLNFYTEFGADKMIGIAGGIMNQSFRNKNEEYFTDAYHDFTNFKVNPYIAFEGANWNANLGININSLIDVKTKFLISPNLRASVHINEVNTLYGEVTGGVNNNTFLDILFENRYANPIARVEYSKKLYDAKIGFKSGVVSSLEFDIFAGYKKTDKDHLYIATPSYIINSTTDANPWSNVATPIYANVGTGHIGGQLKTKLIPYTDLSAKITAYFYDVKYTDSYVDAIGEYMDETTVTTKEAWGRPSFTAELNADIKPFDKLTFSVNYLYAGGRKAYGYNYSTDSYSSVNMKDINELNIKGEYRLLDWVSVHARANNILFQKYELQYGYPLQGFNFMGGLNFTF